MAVPKQVIPYPMTKGQDLGVDKLLASGLLQTDDVVFDDSNTVKQRGGVNFGVGLGANIRRMFTVNGTPFAESVVGDMTALEAGIARAALAPAPSFASGAFATADGKYMRASGLSKRIQSVSRSNTLPQQGFDVNASGAFYAVGWEIYDPTGSFRQGVRFSIRSTATDVEVGGFSLVSTQYRYTLPRIMVNSNGQFVFVYSKQDPVATPTTQSIYAQVYSAAGVVSVAETLILATTEANGHFDVSMCSDGTRFAVVAFPHAAASIVSAQIHASLLTTLVAHPAGVTTGTPYIVGAFISVNAGVYTTQYCYSVRTNVCRGRSVPSSTNVLSGEATIYTAPASRTTGRMVIGDWGDGVTLLVDSYELSTSVQAAIAVVATTATWGSLLSTVVYANALLGGRIATYSGRGYVLTLSGTVSSYTFRNTARSALLLDITGARAAAVNSLPYYVSHTVARLDQYATCRVAMDFANVGGISSTWVSGNKLYVSYLKFETDQLIAGTSSDTSLAISKAEIDFDSQLGFVEYNGITVLAGACPLDCDGQNVYEDGFHAPPEINFVSWGVGPGTVPGINSNTLTIGPFPAGMLGQTVTLALTEAWMDASGNWHEGRPSNRITTTAVLAAPNNYLTIAMSRPMSLKDPSKRRLLVYRTKGSSTDTNLYLSVDAFGTFYDDTFLGNGEVLYSDTRPAQDGAPSCRHLSTYENRLIAASCDDPSQVWASQLIDRGYGISWNLTSANFRVIVPPRAGRVVGSVEMDGKLVVLGEEQVGYVLGSGPDASGVGNFSNFETVVADQGADWNSPRAIGQGGDGVWFYTARGLRCLGRSNELLRDDEGALLGGKLDSLLVVGAGVTYVQTSSNQLIRFFNNGYCFVYDTQWKQWSRFTAHAAEDAVYAWALDQFWHVTSSFGLYYSETAFVDYSGDIPCAVQLPQLQFGGLQGFQRVQKMFAIFDTLPDTVSVDCAYNFGALVNEASGTPPQQFRHDFKTQKCEALSVRISWNAAAARPRLSAVTLQIGLKNGPYRIGSGGTF